MLKRFVKCDFVVSSSVRRARVINWKSVCSVLCCFVQYVEIYTEQRAFEDSINVLFTFEENCCWIIPITSRSLQLTCSIARYVWTVVSTFQKWCFNTRQEGKQGTWKTVKKFEDVELQALLDKDDLQKRKRLAQQLGVSQQSAYNRLREMGKLQKTDGWISHELNNKQIVKRKNTIDILLVWYRIVCASYRYRRWEMDLFQKSQVQRIIGIPRRTIHIDRRTESLWQKNDALCYVWTEWYIMYC